MNAEVEQTKSDGMGSDRAARTSVIIPHFNHGAQLPVAVAAFLEQTLVANEIVIVDDASTDGSVSIAQQLAARHEHVRLLQRRSNAGPNAAINTGLAAATGDYIAFSAADDRVEPTFLERSVKALERHPSAAFSFLDPSRIHLGTGAVEHVPLHLSPSERFFGPSEMQKLFARNSFTISSNTVLYRRSVIGGIGGFREDLAWQADWIALMILAFRKGAVYVPEALAHFTVNPSGYGETGTRSASGQRILLEACLKALEDDYPDVAEHFRAAAMVPEMRLRTLVWLLRTERGRRMLTPRLARRLVLREAWSHLRPFIPTSYRAWFRGRFWRA